MPITLSEGKEEDLRASPQHGNLHPMHKSVNLLEKQTNKTCRDKSISLEDFSAKSSLPLPSITPRYQSPNHQYTEYGPSPSWDLEQRIATNFCEIPPQCSRVIDVGSPPFNSSSQRTPMQSSPLKHLFCGSSSTKQIKNNELNEIKANFSVHGARNDSQNGVFPIECNESPGTFNIENRKRMKKKKKKRKTDFVSREMIKEYIHYSQSEAAKRLGISVSSLKRRFYELNMGIRWPSYKNVNQQQAFVLSTIPDREGGLILVPSKEQLKMEKAMEGKRKMSLEGILCNSQKREKDMDENTLQVLHDAFLQNIGKDEDLDCRKTSETDPKEQSCEYHKSSVSQKSTISNKDSIMHP